MAQQKKNNKKLSREEKYMQKKVELSEEIYQKLCDKKRYKKSYIEKLLKRYGKKLARLELAQNKIRRPIIFFDINNKKEDAPNGSMHYRGRIPGISAISLNYDRVIDNIRNTNSPRDKAIYITNFAQTVLHECTHVEQHEVCEKSKKLDAVTPEYAYKYSLEFLAKDTLGNKYYKRGDNYWKMLFEKDAREEGFSKSLDILSNLIKPNEMHFFYTNDKMDDILNDAYLEPESIYDENGVKRNRDNLNNEIAIDAIGKNPALLKRYPILKKAFNKDGTKKHLYQVIKDNARAEKMVKLNPFLSQEKRNKKMKEVDDLYSEIFKHSIRFYTSEEIDKTCKVVGKVAFNSMIDRIEIHEKNSIKKLVEDIETEKMIRERFKVDAESIQDIYSKRMAYARYTERETDKEFVEIRDFIAKNKHSKVSVINAKKIIDADNEIIKKNIESRSYNNETRSKTSSNHEIAPSFSEVTFDCDLDQMRDLEQQYKGLEESKIQKRDRIRVEYDDLSKSINEKEKNNGIKY